VIVALAAGALVLAVAALAVAVTERRARTRSGAPAPTVLAETVPAETVPAERVPAAPIVPSLPAVGANGPADDASARAATERAERAELLVAIGDALGRAPSVAAVHEVVGRAMAQLVPGRWGELLVSDEPVGTDAPLRAVARSGGPAGELAACPVPTVGQCPSARRAQPLVSGSSSEIDACPWLSGRGHGDCSSLCVPLAEDGRVSGVLQILGPVGRPPSGAEVSDVIWLAGRLSARLEAARDRDHPGPAPESQHLGPGSESPHPDPASESPHPDPASESPVSSAAVDLTDASLGGPPPLDVLTGLPGRATLVRAMDSLRAAGTPFVVVVADVDGLAAVNARSGHAAGDAVVAALGSALSQGLGAAAVVARVDGATLAAACPDLTLGRSVEAIELIRSEVLDLVADGDTVAFTCSFGITHSSVTDEVDDLLRVARVGLDRAQAMGGDQIVYADRTLADEPPQSPG
jgi:diguanylate cyclase (GGDEF)-like protein